MVGFFIIEAPKVRISLSFVCREKKFCKKKKGKKKLKKELSLQTGEGTPWELAVYSEK